MNIRKSIFFIFYFNLVYLTGSGVGINENQNMEVENKRFQVELLSVTGSPKFEIVLKVLEKTSGLIKTVMIDDMFSRFQSVEKLILVPVDKVCVQGHLPRGGRIISIIDLNTYSLIDTLWINRELSFSPSFQFFVYLSYAPKFIPRGFSSVVLLYDLSKSPNENRLTEHSNVENGGIPIFPRENAMAKSYSPLLAGGGTGYTSPFLWSEDESKIVFLHVQRERNSPANKRNNYITAVDISRGVMSPEITKREINIEEYIDVSKQTSSIAARIKNKSFSLWANGLEWFGEELVKIDLSNVGIYGHDYLILNVP